MRDDDFRETVAKAKELHATGDLFAKQIEPEPAPETLWNAPWRKSRTTKTTCPCLTRQHRLELIDMPPALASAPPMSNVALRLVYGAGPH